MIAVLMALALGGPPAAVATAGDGEARLSLDLRDVDVKHVVGLLVEAAGRQSVVDPDVACRVTLRVRELRWRSALEHVLDACGLAVEQDGAILRVAPVKRLREEARERRTLAEEQAQSRTGAWAALRLSYARAAELAPVLQKLLPSGSQVTYDARTNTLFVVAP